MLKNNHRQSLEDYFQSGWKFLLPYVVVYWTWAALGWPIASPYHPTSGLIGVFQILHWGNLAALVAFLWIKGQANRTESSDRANGAPSMVAQWGFWAGIALLIHIPGLYLEWPSDVWEHLRRITEWRFADEVTQHSTWIKFSYVLTFSLFEFSLTSDELVLAHYWQTAMGLLLVYQFIRFGLALGLSTNQARLFGLLVVVLFGNSTFSFIRYYGLSSSILAQVGALAVASQVITIAKSWNRDRSIQANFTDKKWGAISLSAALFFAASNHIQSVALAAIMVLAISISNVAQNRRAQYGLMALFVLSIAMGLILHSSGTREAYDEFISSGWIGPWLGFDLLSRGSPAQDRLMQVLGAIGVVNLVAGLWLVVRKNHVVGWLTITPVLLVSTPVFAVPFMEMILIFKSTDSVVTFHRMLLAGPPGLALIVLFSSRSLLPRFLPILRGGALPLLLAISLILSPGQNAFNRLWHSLVIPPDDLELSHLTSSPTEIPPLFAPDQELLEHPLSQDISTALRDGQYRSEFRRIHDPAYAENAVKLNVILPAVLADFSPESTRESNDHLFVSLRPADLVSTSSLARFQPRDWIGLRSLAPLVNRTDDNDIIVENSHGQRTQAFGADLIPIDPARKYHIQMTIRQTRPAKTRNYLAVAWYDRERELLAANAPPPAGAGRPRGWSNGTFSYFGVINQSVDELPQSHEARFGWGESREVPLGAAFVRIGAMLNYDGIEDVTVELWRVELREIENPLHLTVRTPCPHALFTFASTTGRLSGHWPTGFVAAAHAGSSEVLHAAGRD